jgi:hypothetical protein
MAMVTICLIRLKVKGIRRGRKGKRGLSRRTEMGRNWALARGMGMGRWVRERRMDSRRGRCGMARLGGVLGGRRRHS